MKNKIFEPGIYKGAWTGYQIIVENGLTMVADKAIRGINIPCTIHITQNRQVSVITTAGFSPECSTTLTLK